MRSQRAGDAARHTIRQGGATMLSAQMAAVRRTFIALRNRNFCLFWTGSVVSQAGTWVQNTALAWLMLQLTHSPLAFSTLTTIQ
ncbi:MAG TPA: MFS transporter, partial [Dehalococcoidia bacterium]|nr:MFS transporter [Dehalococcoidia bacterium]